MLLHEKKRFSVFFFFKFRSKISLPKETTFIRVGGLQTKEILFILNNCYCEKSHYLINF